MEQTVQRRVRIIPAKRDTDTPQPGKKKHQRVAAYCRVSTDSEEQITSYEAQKAYYTQKIEENPDWELAGIFADKGLSGTSMKKRENFNKMIAACKRGKIDTILTKSLSRFARNTVDCLETVRMLKAHGIGVIFEKENINTLTESSEFLITLFSGFAQAESESLSKNIIWGKEESKKAGKVPFQYKKLLGYRKGLDGKPEIEPQEAETVRRIYRRYLDGCSLSQIQQELEADRVPTAQAVQRWSYQVIRNILTNERYSGNALLRKRYTTDTIPRKVKRNRGERPMCFVAGINEAVVSQEIFDKAQELRKKRWENRLVDPDIFISRQNELAEQLRAAKLEKERFLKAEEDQTIQQTQELIETLEAGPDFLDAFDGELFRELVDKIIVESNDRLRFRLVNGLELTEPIERTMR